MATPYSIDLSQTEAPPARRWNRSLNSISKSKVAANPNCQLVSGDDALSSERLRISQDLWQRLVDSCSPESPLEDPDFPAEPRSLFGRESQVVVNSGRSAPRCRCGAEASKSQVQKEGPTKGRPYWHCAARRCGFFAWADAQARQNARMWWQRFPEFVVVSDFGFRAEDLRQGGVGDCWFMSALAVVAERSDLIMRLFAGKTSKNSAGCYQVQLFLDGEWQGIIIDDRLPCTEQQRRPDGSGIAYSRADGQQLWTALVEKAYAKAHGSYKAISGGEVAEALLDLTGCPTESINFDEHGFQPQELWRRMLKFKEMEFPMGCGTASKPDLEEVGLCGGHAYSILDVREIYDPGFIGKPLGYGGAEEEGKVRLLRIRNPHGVGEWNGEWGDNSSAWTDTLAMHLGRTGVNDGTFWMDFTHFLMAFEEVDVCFAHRGWHSRSFDNVFCTKTSATRLCKYAYELRSEAVTNLYAMALQPTKRGAWCRDDRKKSYKPGDVSLLLVRLNKDRTLDAVVGGNFFCADIMARRSIEITLDRPGATYVLLIFSFGAGPVAHGGEVKGHAPFKLRLFSSQPVWVRPSEAEHDPHLAKLATLTLHTACLTLYRAPGRPFRRQVRRLGEGIILFQVTGEGAVFLLIANSCEHQICVTLRADVKVMTARSAEGLVASSVPAADEKSVKELTCFNCGKVGHLASDCPNPKQRGVRTPWRYPAKWRRVTAECRVPTGMQRLAMSLIGNGMQTELGSIEAEVSDLGGEVQSGAKFQGLQQWCGGTSADVFGPQPLDQDLVAAACLDSERKVISSSAFMLDEGVDVIKEASLASLRNEEERQLARVLAESTGASQVSFQSMEEQVLARVLAESRGAAHSGNLLVPQYCTESEVPALDSADADLALVLAASKEAAEDAALQAALRLSTAPSALVHVYACSNEATTIIESDSDIEISQLQPIITGSPDPKRPKVSVATAPLL